MSSRRPLRLLLLGALALLAALTVYHNALWLSAQAYMRFAEDQWAWPEARDAAKQASEIALRLQPFSARARQQQASDRLLLGQGEQALAEYAAALTMAPADAFLWRDYALALLYTGAFDARLDRAVAQAQAWGARSSTIQLSLAIAGLKAFHQSDAPLRARWMNSIRYAYWDQPGVVLQAAYLSEQELLLCSSVILKADTNPWCAAARWRHGLCSAKEPGLDACAAGRRE